MRISSQTTKIIWLYFIYILWVVWYLSNGFYCL